MASEFLDNLLGSPGACPPPGRGQSAHGERKGEGQEVETDANEGRRRGKPTGRGITSRSTQRAVSTGFTAYSGRPELTEAASVASRFTDRSVACCGPILRGGFASK